MKREIIMCKSKDDGLRLYNLLKDHFTNKDKYIENIKSFGDKIVFEYTSLTKKQD